MEIKNTPLKLTNERPWRTYLGGSLLDALHGQKGLPDGHFPEEWIASVTVSKAAQLSSSSREGLSRLKSCQTTTLKDLLENEPASYLGAKHAQRFGGELGVLVKLIDSAERLSVQAHPDRAKAAEFFATPYGKTECWHILETRAINGQTPCVYLGFRPGVSREDWEKLFAQQDVPGMLACLHRFAARPGDTFFVEGGVPHAIGAGCFLVEIQEPTDFTFRLDRITPSGFELSEEMCHQGIGFAKMFDCFHYEGFSKEETQKRWLIPPRLLNRQSGGTVTSLIGYETTPFFQMNLLECAGTLTVSLPEAFSGLYILAGEGALAANGDEQPASSGEQFFLPALTGEFILKPSPGQTIKAMHFFGPLSSD